MSLIKQDVMYFLESQPFCVIATASSAAQPEAAYVAYTSNDNLELVIGTSNQSRKYANIVQNSSAAFVIADKAAEVQYEGEVEVITAAAYETMTEEGRFKKLSGFDKYRNDPSQVYLKVSPTWIRFILHGDPDQIVEFTEFT